MAYFHCHISNVSRAKGSSCTAALAYITGLVVHDERTGETYRYGRQERIVTYSTIIPDYAPVSFRDPVQLFNAIEQHEKASNARTAKKIDAALPREFSDEQRLQVVEDYIRKNLVSKGYCVTYAIHCDAEAENPHVHMLITNRSVTKNGTWSLSQKKDYVYELDEYGKPKLDESGNKIRVPVIDKKTGEQKVDSRNRKQWKRVVIEDNSLNDKKFLQSLRDAWADECNLYLDEGSKITSKSFKDLSIDREPTIHEGYAARQIEKEGGISKRCEANRQIRHRNFLREQAERMRDRLFAEIRTLQSRIRNFGKDKLGYEESDRRAVDGKRIRSSSKSAEKTGSARGRKPGFEAKNHQKRYQNPGAGRTDRRNIIRREIGRAAVDLAQSLGNITSSTEFEEGDQQEEREIRESSQRMLQLAAEIIRSAGSFTASVRRDHQSIIRESRTAISRQRAVEGAARKERSDRDALRIGQGAEESERNTRQI